MREASLDPTLALTGGGRTRQEDAEVSPTQSRKSPSIQRVLRQTPPAPLAQSEDVEARLWKANVAGYSLHPKP